MPQMYKTTVSVRFTIIDGHMYKPWHNTLMDAAFFMSVSGDTGEFKLYHTPEGWVTEDDLYKDQDPKTLPWAVVDIEECVTEAHERLLDSEAN